MDKCMEVKVRLSRDECGADLKSLLELEYYLLESDVNDGDEMMGKKVYGIEIIKRSVRNENLAEIEEKVITNLSCCKDDTKRILEKLASHSVTPVELPFVLDDMIGI